MLRSMGANLRATLKRIRDMRGLTQEELAQRAGMTRTDVNRIENGNRQVGEKVLARLAAALDVSVIELAPAAEPDQRGLDLDARLAGVEAALNRLGRTLAELADLPARVQALEQQGQPRRPQAGSG